MDLQPKPEPGLPPIFGSTTNNVNIHEMSIPQLFTLLLCKFTRKEQYDSVEKVLVARDERLKAEIASLQVRVEVERMDKVKAEEEVRNRDDLYKKWKKAEECYNNLLKEVKENWSNDTDSIKELRDQRDEALAENHELRKERKKWFEDSKEMAELTVRVGNLEGEVEAGKKKCEDDKIVLDALRKRNDELEEAQNDIDELRAENTRLLGEKTKLVALLKSKERKFMELNEQAKEMEDAVKLLMSVDDASGCCEWKEPKAEPEDSHHSLGANNDAPHAPATGTNTIIEIQDSSDDDDETNGREQKNLSSWQTIDMHKRKYCFSDISN